MSRKNPRNAPFPTGPKKGESSHKVHLSPDQNSSDSAPKAGLSNSFQIYNNKQSSVSSTSIDKDSLLNKNHPKVESAPIFGEIIATKARHFSIGNDVPSTIAEEQLTQENYQPFDSKLSEEEDFILENNEQAAIKISNNNLPHLSLNRSNPLL